MRFVVEGFARCGDSDVGSTTGERLAGLAVYNGVHGPRATIAAQ